MYCSKCGKEIADDSKFCNHCGANIGQNEPLNDNSQVFSKCKNQNWIFSKKHMPIILGGLLIVFSVLFIIVINPRIKYNKQLSTYNSAKQMTDSGQYLDAYNTFIELGHFLDSYELAKQIEHLATKQRIAISAKGDIITFGSYEQDNNYMNGKENIEWIIICKENDRVLLMSRYSLDAQEYHYEDANISWKTSSVRAWLNEDFYDDAFTLNEQTIIKSTILSNPDSFDEDAKVVSTVDKVFLLSVNERYQYFSSPYNFDDWLVTTRTAYADRNYVTGNNSKSAWLLRSTVLTGYWNDVECYVVRGNGDIDYTLVELTYDIRPCIWIDITS